MEKAYGYVFFITSQRYLETGDRRYTPIGAGPIVVDREQRHIVMLPTYLAAVEALAQYESGRLGGTLLARL